MKRWIHGAIALITCTALTCTLTGTAVSVPSNAREYILSTVATNVQAVGAKGDGQADASNLIAQAIEQACSGGEGSVYLPAGTYRIKKNLVVPKEAELVFEKGACLWIDADASVTYNGSISAGNSAVFQGEGKVKGTPLTSVGNPYWFGAKGDGKTDDTVAFQKTINMFLQVDIPYSEAGYVISDLVISRNYSLFQGESEQRKAKLIAAPTAKRVLSISCSNVDVQYLAFEMAAAPMATCLYYDDSRAGIELCNARYIDAVDAYCVLTDANHAGNLVVTSKFEHFRCMDGRGTAVVMNDMWGFIFMTDAVLDYSHSAQKHGITVDFPGFKIKDNAGAILTDITVIGDPNGTEDAHGFQVLPGAAMWFRRCVAESCGGDGFNVYGGSWVYILDSVVRNCKNNGFYINSCSYLQLINATVSYNENVAPTADGVVFKNGAYNQIQNLKVNGAKRYGMFLQGAKNVVGTDLEINGCGIYGLYDKGSKNSFVNVTGENNRNRLVYDSERVC